MEKIVSTLTDRLRIANENIHPYATADPSAVVLKQLRLLLRFRAGENREAVSAPFPEMVTEIAHDLGLSARRVAAILTRAGEEGTIRLRDNTIALAEHDPG
jgi:CRP-like cAMP-binding protein